MAMWGRAQHAARHARSQGTLLATRMRRQNAG
jgi:hypothetical protein